MQCILNCTATPPLICAAWPLTLVKLSVKKMYDIFIAAWLYTQHILIKNINWKMVLWRLSLSARHLSCCDLNSNYRVEKYLRKSVLHWKDTGPKVPPYHHTDPCPPPRAVDTRSCWFMESGSCWQAAPQSAVSAVSSCSAGNAQASGLSMGPFNRHTPALFKPGKQNVIHTSRPNQNIHSQHCKHHI